MKTCCAIWWLFIMVIGLGMPQRQAHAQAPGCMVMEVMLEEQGATSSTAYDPPIDWITVCTKVR